MIVEVHGDWRTFSRLYGSPARRLISPLADAVAAYAVRRADATRAVSSFTAGLVEETRGVPPSAVFTAFSDLSAFAERPPVPLPERPTVAFVGALEAYKNVEGLAAAWRLVAERLPAAGARDRRQRLAAGGRRHGSWRTSPAASSTTSGSSPRLSRSSSTLRRCSCCPSWPEGLGRVIIESFARGRAVVATDGGGIPDLVTHEVEGLLVPPADSTALAVALERVLADRELAERMGAAARERYGDWHSTPEQLAGEMRALVEAAVAGTAR